MAAITVAAPSQMPSVAKHPFSSTGADTPFAASTTSRIYTSLTDVTRKSQVFQDLDDDQVDSTTQALDYLRSTIGSLEVWIRLARR